MCKRNEFQTVHGFRTGLKTRQTSKLNEFSFDVRHVLETRARHVRNQPPEEHKYKHEDRLLCKVERFLRLILVGFILDALKGVVCPRAP